MLLLEVVSSQLKTFIDSCSIYSCEKYSNSVQWWNATSTGSRLRFSSVASFQHTLEPETTEVEAIGSHFFFFF